MDSVMKILVTTIAAAALVAVIYMMFVIPADDPGMLIKKQLEIAQVELGKIQQIKMMEYSKDYALQGKTFDVRGRSVAFECNNENMCCMKDEKCGEIEWDERLITFRKKQPAETISRCFLEEGIFVCRVYFGQEPAQIEIEEIIAEENLDISIGNEFPVSVKMKNSGSSVMPYGSVDMKLYQWQTQFDKSKLVFITQINQPITVMNPDEEITKKFIFNPETSGKYEIHIKAEGENSGFWEKIIEFNVTGIPVNDCKIKRAEVEISCDNESGKEKQRYYCENCKFGFECKEAWEKEFSADFQIWDKTLTYVLSDEDCYQDAGEVFDETSHTSFNCEDCGLSPATKIGLQWAIPISFNDIPKRSGLPKCDSFNHPYDTAHYRAGLYPHRFESIHRGMDIYAVSNGVPVYAAADGEIIKISTTFGVYLLHRGTNGEEYTSIYGHSKAISGLTVGQFVTKGQRISTIEYSPAHLHFEMYNTLISSAAPSSKWGKNGAKLLSNDQYLINPIELIGPLGACK